MPDDSLYTRRRLLQAAGGATVVGLAGCVGSQTGDGDGDEGSGSATDHHDEDDGDHGGGEDDHDGGAGHADDEHGHGTVGEPTATADVAVNTTEDGEAHFRPHVTRVEQGGTVTWVLESGTHTATAYHPANDQPALEDPPEDKPAAVREKIAELNGMCNEALGHGH
jgi:plastocyanin